MADNENDGAKGSFRQGPGNKRRREPPIIDAKATDVTRQTDPVDEPIASDPPASAAEPSPVAAAEEPVLFSQVLRGSNAAPAEPTATPPAEETAVPPPSPEAESSSAADPAVEAGSASPPIDSSVPPSPEADEPPPIGIPSYGEASPSLGLGTAPPLPPQRSSAGWIFGGIAGLLLLVVLGLLLFGAPRGGTDDLKAALDAANGRLAALEARPDPAPLVAKVSQIDQRSGAVDAQLPTLQATVDDLGRRLKVVEADSQANTARLSANPMPTADAGAPTADVSALSGRLDDLSHKVDALPVATAPTDLGPLDAKLADLSHRIDDAQNAVASLPKIDLGPIEAKTDDAARRIDGVDQGLRGLKASVAAIPRIDLAPLAAAIAAEDQRIAPLEAEFAAPKSAEHVTEARAVGNADTAHAAPLLVVAAEVGKRIDAGQSLVTEIDALRAMGIDDTALAPLSAIAQKGSPTVAALKAQWADVEPSVSASTRPKTGNGLLDKFAAGAFQIVKVRKVGAPAGEDAESVIARIDAALDDGNVEAAVAEWSKLPDGGREASKDWADAAKARLDASAAAQGLIVRAMDTLAKSKG